MAASIASSEPLPLSSEQPQLQQLSIGAAETAAPCEMGDRIKPLLELPESIDKIMSVDEVLEAFESDELAMYINLDDTDIDNNISKLNNELGFNLENASQMDVPLLEISPNDKVIGLNSSLEEEQPPPNLCPPDTPLLGSENNDGLPAEASATPMKDFELLDNIKLLDNEVNVINQAAENSTGTAASATQMANIIPLVEKLRELLSKQKQDGNLLKELHNYAINSKGKNKYFFLLSLLTASETLLLELLLDENVKAKALSLIISLSSSLIFLLNTRNESHEELDNSIKKLQNTIADLVLKPRQDLGRTTSHGSAEYPRRFDSDKDAIVMFDRRQNEFRRCSTEPSTNKANVAESKEQAISLIKRGLNVTDKYLNTVIINVGNMSVPDDMDSETTENVKLLLEETIITYRRVLTHNIPATIICLCKLLGKLMSVSRDVSGSILNLIINIIKAIHNGLMVTGLYPYVIGASVVYYARYEIAQGVIIVAKNGAFYILKSTIAQQGLKWLREIIRKEATAAATQVAEKVAEKVGEQAATQIATQVARDLITEHAAQEARGRLTSAITNHIFTILANPANMGMIMDGARLALETGARLALPGGKKKRTKKRKRRRRGGSKKTKRRVKKSKKGGKRRRGGSKKRNRRSQRKTKK